LNRLIVQPEISLTSADNFSSYPELTEEHI